VVHHNKPFLATASDDGTWSIWALPKGEKIMTGDGHSDWISDVAFHPLGTHLATASGDC
jgi:WD40 repeat protein